MNWDYKEEWWQRGKNFLIAVKRHEEKPSSFSSDEEGPHRWCVYAYIYPDHPHFAAFGETDEMYQRAATMLPLHGHPSFFHRHVDDGGNTTSFQVGADYHHLHDAHFTHMATKDEAAEVFADAEELYAELVRLWQVAEVSQ